MSRRDHTSHGPPRRSRSRLLAADLTAVAIFGAAARTGDALAAACLGANAQPTQASGEAITRATLCMVNAERARRGLGTLRLQPELSVAARRHSGDMPRRHYFSHTAPGGRNFLDHIRRTGDLRSVHNWVVAENIAWDSGAEGSAGGHRGGVDAQPSAAPRGDSYSYVRRRRSGPRRPYSPRTGRRHLDNRVRRQGPEMTAQMPDSTQKGPVLFAYDGSEYAKAAIWQAGQQLQKGRRASVLSVWKPAAAMAFAAAPGLPPVGFDRDLKKRARRVANEGARLARSSGFQAEPTAERGDIVWQRIVESAEEHDASILVMGTHGRTAISLALVGSVAAATARHSDRPVLIAHSHPLSDPETCP